MEIPWCVTLPRWEGWLLRCSLHFLCEDVCLSWLASCAKKNPTYLHCLPNSATRGCIKIFVVVTQHRRLGWHHWVQQILLLVWLWQQNYTLLSRQCYFQCHTKRRHDGAGASHTFFGMTATKISRPVFLWHGSICSNKITCLLWALWHLPNHTTKFN